MSLSLRNKSNTENAKEGSWCSCDASILWNVASHGKMLMHEPFQLIFIHIKEECQCRGIISDSQMSVWDQSRQISITAFRWWCDRAISGRYQRAFKRGEQRICGYQMKALGRVWVTQTCYERWATSGAMDLILWSPVITLSLNADSLFSP